MTSRSRASMTFSSWMPGRKVRERKVSFSFWPTATGILPARSGFRLILPRVGLAFAHSATQCLSTTGWCVKLNVEESPGKVEASSADALLNEL
jgi:hypothetical protein